MAIFDRGSIDRRSLVCVFLFINLFLSLSPSHSLSLFLSSFLPFVSLRPSFSFSVASRGGTRHARQHTPSYSASFLQDRVVAFLVVTSFVTSLDTRVTNHQLSASVLVPPVRESIPPFFPCAIHNDINPPCRRCHFNTHLHQPSPTDPLLLVQSFVWKERSWHDFYDFAAFISETRLEERGIDACLRTWRGNQSSKRG